MNLHNASNLTHDDLLICGSSLEIVLIQMDSKNSLEFNNAWHLLFHFFHCTKNKNKNKKKQM